jgi:D-glycero-alpha-D-manno-heptose-7-phosphate kinase
MIISKTPFRISLFGGSTDYQSYYSKHGSFLIGFAMDKYCYTTLRFNPAIFPYKSKISYSKIETVDSNNEIEHNGVRGTLNYFGLKEGVEISCFSDLPSQTGIGSSSSFVVGLVNAMNKLLYPEDTYSADDLAYAAIHIERNLLKEPGGCQDQIYAAYGGFISIEIDREGTAKVKPLPISSSFMSEFFSRSVLVYTGKSRDSFDIAKSHSNELAKLKIHNLALDAYKLFLKEDISNIAKLLNDSWHAKKSISNSISNNEVDDIYSKLLKSGMIGGKLLGSGGSGFIFGICKDETSVGKIKKKFQTIDFGVSKTGSEIINV